MSCTEEREVWYVEVLKRSDHNLIYDVKCDTYEQAQFQKDLIDLELESIYYSAITHEFEETEE